MHRRRLLARQPSPGNGLPPNGRAFSPACPRVAPRGRRHAFARHGGREIDGVNPSVRSQSLLVDTAATSAEPAVCAIDRPSRVPRWSRRVDAMERVVTDRSAPGSRSSARHFLLASAVPSTLRVAIVDQDCSASIARAAWAACRSVPNLSWSQRLSFNEYRPQRSAE